MSAGSLATFCFCVHAARSAGSLATCTTSAGCLATCTVLTFLFRCCHWRQAGSRLGPAMGKWKTVLRLEVKVRADHSTTSSSSGRKEKKKKKKGKRKEEKEKKKKTRTGSPSAEREAGSCCLAQFLIFLLQLSGRERSGREREGHHIVGLDRKQRASNFVFRQDLELSAASDHETSSKDAFVACAAFQKIILLYLRQEEPPAPLGSEVSTKDSSQARKVTECRSCV